MQKSAVVDFPFIEIARRVRRSLLQREHARRRRHGGGDDCRAFCRGAGAWLARQARRCIGIVGWKGSGKTTLIERLIPALRSAGSPSQPSNTPIIALRQHDGATDGERHARAGAVNVAVIGPEAWELAGARQETPPPSLEAAAARLEAADVILVEGFKSAAIPKIEVRGENARAARAGGRARHCHRFRPG